MLHFACGNEALGKPASTCGTLQTAPVPYKTPAFQKSWFITFKEPLHNPNFRQIRACNLLI